MEMPVLLNDDLVRTLSNHLWQSTIVIFACWLLNLSLGRFRAGVRYWVWTIALFKLLVPFGILVASVEALRPQHVVRTREADVVNMMVRLTGPIVLQGRSGDPGIVAKSPGRKARSSTTLRTVIATGWAMGFLVVCFGWIRSWAQVRAKLRRATNTSLWAGIPVFTSTEVREPGVFGVARSAIVLPATIYDTLSESQLNTVMAHEEAHVRRHDNLMAAIHLFITAIFWFYPIAWWVKEQLMHERERACDEAVLEAGTNPRVYAESILAFCRVTVTPSLLSISGGPGSDLEDRIVRIMSDRMPEPYGNRHRVVLICGALTLFTLPVAAGMAHVRFDPLTSTTMDVSGITGTWQGMLHASRDLRLVLKMSKTSGQGQYEARLYSIDQGGDEIAINDATLVGAAVKLSADSIGATFEGQLSGDGQEMAGTWKQLPTPQLLTLKRTGPATVWSIPSNTTAVQPMNEAASPDFRVEKIALSRPNSEGNSIDVQGRRFQASNTTVKDLIAFAFGVQNNEVLDGTPWVGSDKFEISGEPTDQGAPSLEQWKLTVRKLLGKQFKLSYHMARQARLGFILQTDLNGARLARTRSPKQMPSMGFRKLGDLTVSHATVDEFATSILAGAVLSCPVIDRTGIVGRYDFTLEWTPNNSQFSGMGITPSPVEEPTHSQIDLETALRAQLGLKLVRATVTVPVMVIDHVEKPF